MGISDDSWTETRVTWDNLPTLGSTAKTVNMPDAAYGWKIIDVTAFVQDEINGDGILSLVIMKLKYSSICVPLSITLEAI